MIEEIPGNHQGQQKEEKENFLVRKVNIFKPIVDQVIAVFYAAASPVAHEDALGAQFGTPDGSVSIFATENTLEVYVWNEFGYDLGYSVPTVFEVKVKSAHLEGTVVIEDWDSGTAGDDLYLLVIDVDFTAYEPADLYPLPLPDGRQLYISQGAEVSGSVTIEPLPAGPPRPSGMSTTLLKPEDGKVGAGSSVIMKTRLIQPPNWPNSFVAAARSTAARDLFSQTPVLN